MIDVIEPARDALELPIGLLPETEKLLSCNLLGQVPRRHLQIAVGGEQFVGSRGSRPLGIRSAMKRTYEENASFYTVAGFLMLSLLLVVAVLLIVALSLSFLLLRNS